MPHLGHAGSVPKRSVPQVVHAATLAPYRKVVLTKAHNQSLHTHFMCYRRGFMGTAVVILLILSGYALFIRSLKWEKDSLKAQERERAEGYRE